MDDDRNAEIDKLEAVSGAYCSKKEATSSARLSDEKPAADVTERLSGSAAKNTDTSVNLDDDSSKLSGAKGLEFSPIKVETRKTKKLLPEHVADENSLDMKDVEAGYAMMTDTTEDPQGQGQQSGQEVPGSVTFRPRDPESTTQPGAVAVRGPDADENENEDVVSITSSLIEQKAQDEAVRAEVVDTEKESRQRREQIEREVQQGLERELAERERNAPIAEVVSYQRCSPRVRHLSILGGALVIVAAIVLGVVLPRVLDSESTPPSPTPSEVRQDLTDLLASMSFDDGTALTTPLTPQNLALNWLANNTHLDTYSDQKKGHRYAMATLYYSTNGDQWTRSDGWLTDNDECGWYRHITDDAFQPPTCNDKGVISVIALQNQNLRGTLPLELALLTNGLEFLNLGKNSLLTGPIPSTMGLFKGFRQLLLFDTAINGPIPTEIGRIEKLDHLNLRDVRHTGTLPTELGHLTNLAYIVAANSLLSGTLLTELGLMTALSHASLRGNVFSGSIPSEIGLLTALETLDLSENKLIGAVPTEILLLTNLKKLRLNDNFLNGTCPSQIDDCRI